MPKDTPDQPPSNIPSDGGETRTVVLGVTGCIAAYKACELVRAMRREGWRVKVVMTEHATEFVTPLTMQTLSGETVASDLFVVAGEGPLPHLSLAEEADCLLVAPATANIMAKVAHGVADDLLSTTALATEAPLVFAPAMNTRMWEDDATRHAVATLRERGGAIVEPGSGALACGDEGEGRLAELDDIMAAVRFELGRARLLARRRVVVTAGGTQEPIDAVRFIGNRSSGLMGYSLAEEARAMGAEVVLISAPTALPRPGRVEVVDVGTADQMRAAVLAEAGPGAPRHTDVLVMAAAVADYRPERALDQKMHKGEGPVSLPLVRTVDILAEVGERRGQELGRWPAVLVGFAAETSAGEALAAAAGAKLERKDADIVVGNDVSDPARGFGSPVNQVVIVTRDGPPEWVGPAHKRVVARRIWERVAAMLGEGTAGQ